MKNNFLLFILVLIGTFTCFHYSSAGTREINLTALGDSITHGTGDPSKKGYIERFKVKFEEKKNIPIKVSNLAIPRYTTENILEQLQDGIIQMKIKKADYIILYIGTNDFRKSAAYKFNQLNEKKINDGEIKFSVNLHQILENIRNENPAAPIMLLGLYHPYAKYQNQQEILQLIEQWNSEIVEVIADFDQTYYVPTLDLFINKPKNIYFHDTLHPNHAGYELIADRLLEKVIVLERNSD